MPLIVVIIGALDQLAIPRRSTVIICPVLKFAECLRMALGKMTVQAVVG